MGALHWLTFYVSLSRGNSMNFLQSITNFSKKDTLSEDIFTIKARAEQWVIEARKRKREEMASTSSCQDESVVVKSQDNSAIPVINSGASALYQPTVINHSGLTCDVSRQGFQTDEIKKEEMFIETYMGYGTNEYRSPNIFLKSSSGNDSKIYDKSKRESANPSNSRSERKESWGDIKTSDNLSKRKQNEKSTVKSTSGTERDIKKSESNYSTSQGSKEKKSESGYRRYRDSRKRKPESDYRRYRDSRERKSMSDYKSSQDTRGSDYRRFQNSKERKSFRDSTKSRYPKERNKEDKTKEKKPERRNESNCEKRYTDSKSRNKEDRVLEKSKIESKRLKENDSIRKSNTESWEKIEKEPPPLDGNSVLWKLDPSSGKWVQEEVSQTSPCSQIQEPSSFQVSQIFSGQTTCPVLIPGQTHSQSVSMQSLERSVLNSGQTSIAAKSQLQVDQSHFSVDQSMTLQQPIENVMNPAQANTPLTGQEGLSTGFVHQGTCGQIVYFPQINDRAQGLSGPRFEQQKTLINPVQVCNPIPTQTSSECNPTKQSLFEPISSHQVSEPVCGSGPLSEPMLEYQKLEGPSTNPIQFYVPVSDQLFSVPKEKLLKALSPCDISTKVCKSPMYHQIPSEPMHGQQILKHSLNRTPAIKPIVPCEFRPESFVRNSDIPLQRVTHIAKAYSVSSHNDQGNRMDEEPITSFSPQFKLIDKDKYKSGRFSPSSFASMTPPDAVSDNELESANKGLADMEWYSISSTDSKALSPDRNKQNSGWKEPDWEDDQKHESAKMIKTVRQREDRSPSIEEVPTEISGPDYNQKMLETDLNRVNRWVKSMHFKTTHRGNFQEGERSGRVMVRVKPQTIDLTFSGEQTREKQMEFHSPLITEHNRPTSIPFNRSSSLEIESRDRTHISPYQEETSYPYTIAPSAYHRPGRGRVESSLVNSRESSPENIEIPRERPEYRKHIAPWLRGGSDYANEIRSSLPLEDISEQSTGNHSYERSDYRCDRNLSPPSEIEPYDRPIQRDSVRQRYSPQHYARPDYSRSDSPDFQDVPKRHHLPDNYSIRDEIDLHSGVNKSGDWDKYSRAVADARSQSFLGESSYNASFDDYPDFDDETQGYSSEELTPFQNRIHDRSEYLPGHLYDEGEMCQPTLEGYYNETQNTEPSETDEWVDVRYSNPAIKTFNLGRRSNLRGGRSFRGSARRSMRRSSFFK